MDKTCIEIRELMAMASDATPNERIAIEAHVPVCSECAGEQARLQAMIGNLALLREGTMPPGASERIWRGVQSAVPGSRRPRILGWTARAAAVLVIGLVTGQEIVLGLGAPEMVLLVLTLAVSTLTFASARTNVLLGAVHLLLFLTYLMMVFDR